MIFNLTSNPNLSSYPRTTKKHRASTWGMTVSTVAIQPLGRAIHTFSPHWCPSLEIRLWFSIFVVGFCPKNRRCFGFHEDINEYTPCPNSSLISFSCFPSTLFCLCSSFCHQYFIHPSSFYLSFSALPRPLAKCIIPGSLHTPEAHIQQLGASQSHCGKDKCIYF